MKQAAFNAVALCLCLAASQVHANTLVSPIKTPSVTDEASKPVPCPEPFDPVFSIEGTTYYSDSSKSVPDPERKKADRAAAAPLQKFEAAVLEQSDHYLETGEPRAALCVVRLLKNWASEKALLGEFNGQGNAHKRWGTVGLTLAFLIVRDNPELSRDDVTTVADWLGEVGRSVRDAYPDSKMRNNHLYWSAAAAVTSGIASGDNDLFDWGIAKAREGINDISAEGTLPLEMKRGAKALGYHSFALTALVLVAEFAAPNGVDLYAENNNALSRLANLIIKNMDDTSAMDAMAGAKQEEPDEGLRNFHWAEPYYARTKDARLLPYLEKARPITYRHLGNVTLLFGATQP